MIPKPFAFVLMPFSASFDDTYHLGIKPACEEAGFYCERLDEQIFEERMLDRIYNQISKADLIIADLSDRNPNVFYETGYAHALGKRVILLTKNGEDIPFDLKHHFHIIYSDGIKSLKEALKSRASFYLRNPSSSTLNPFDQVTLILNEWILLDTREMPIEIEVPVSWSSKRGFGGSSVEILAEFHLNVTSPLPKIDIDVRLITPRIFDISGRTSWGTNLLYGKISMPDGTLLHKPEAPVTVSIGDPDSIKFELYSSDLDAFVLNSKHSLILRLISSGLVRDLHIEVTLVDEDVALG